MAAAAAAAAGVVVVVVVVVVVEVVVVVVVVVVAGVVVVVVVAEVGMLVLYGRGQGRVIGSTWLRALGPLESRVPLGLCNVLTMAILLLGS